MKNRIPRFIYKLDLDLLLKIGGLLVFCAFITYSFLITTTFRIIWPESVVDYLSYGLLLFIILRVGYVNKYSFREIILVSLIFAVFLVAWHRNGWDVLFPLLLLIIGMRELKFQKIVQIYFCLKVILLSITVICALTGIIENLVYQWEGRNTRISFGIGYPTDFSAQLFFLALCYIYIRRESIKYIEIVLLGVLGGFVYFACEARWNTICFFGLMAVLLYYKGMITHCKKRGKIYTPRKATLTILAIMPVLSSIFMIGLSILYNPQSKVMKFLNDLTSLRLVYSKKAIDVYGFSLLGQPIPMHGNGGTTAENLYGFYLDSSYVSIILQYGIIVFGIVIFILLLINFEAIKRKDYILLIVMTAMCVQCMIEHHMLDAAYNPFIWALFADMENKHTLSLQNELENENENY